MSSRAIATFVMVEGVTQDSRPCSADDAAQRRQRRPLNKPALATQNGTTKFSAQRTHVKVVASPPAITPLWLMSVSTRPTTSAIRVVRRRFSRRAQYAQASRARTRMPAAARSHGVEEDTADLLSRSCLRRAIMTADRSRARMHARRRASGARCPDSACPSATLTPAETDELTMLRTEFGKRPVKGWTNRSARERVDDIARMWPE